MNIVLRVAAAFAAGAVAMYYLDPVVGRRRRALVRDKEVAARHDVGDFVRAKSKRAADRVHGAVARTGAKLSTESVTDRQLHERIRAKLGHLIDHSGDVEVDVHDRHVVLSGNASAEEVDELMKTVSAMRGVEGVENRLSMNEGSQRQ